MRIFLFTFFLFFPTYHIHCVEFPQIKPDLLSLIPYAASWCAHTFITQQTPDYYISLPSPRVQLVNLGISATFIGISWWLENFIKTIYRYQKITDPLLIDGQNKEHGTTPLYWIIFFRCTCKVGELATLGVVHTAILGANGCFTSKKHLLGTGLYLVTMQLLSAGLLYKYKSEEYKP